jgi:MtN3 and saliva related transmembrane protein
MAVMDLTTVLGSAAALCSTVSFAPQAWKIIRSRSTQGLSPWMYGVTVVGFALWLAYGIRLGEWPLMITNGICLLFSGFILLMILLPRQKTEAVAATLDPTDGSEADRNAGDVPGAS